VLEHMAKVAAIYPAAARLALVKMLSFLFNWRPKAPADVFSTRKMVMVRRQLVR